ncbi:ArsR/SmtB family transcription factor [Yoonia sp.]|uniref:ArsR/SmtB family transcription factor n=1 Tax=Yoonia sp. TaxID=2212373 RepID=UPI00391B0ACC
MYRLTAICRRDIMLDQETITQHEAALIASIAKGLAHPARIRIVSFLLSRPGCIGGDIVDQVGLAQSTVSEHLRILKDSEIVQGTIEYPRICYSLNPAALSPIRKLIDTIAARSPDSDIECRTADEHALTATSID